VLGRAVSGRDEDDAPLLADHPALLSARSHKRFDPVYSDAKMRSKDIGDFSFFNSYMSQPKSQLQTFSAWAGVDSDISYYLNSHHVGRGLVV